MKLGDKKGAGYMLKDAFSAAQETGGGHSSRLLRDIVSAQIKIGELRVAVKIVMEFGESDRRASALTLIEIARHLAARERN